VRGFTARADRFPRKPARRVLFINHLDEHVRVPNRSRRIRRLRTRCGAADEDWGVAFVGAGQYISIFIGQLLYPLINVKKLLPFLVDLFGKFKAFEGFNAFPYMLAGIFGNEVVPND